MATEVPDKDREYYSEQISDREPFDISESLHISEYAYEVTDHDGVDWILVEQCAVNECTLYLYAIEDWYEYKKPLSQTFSEMREKIKEKALNGDVSAIAYLKTQEAQYTGIEMISMERKRQINEENFSLTHDDDYHYGELTQAAIAYLKGDLISWPEHWDESWFKPDYGIRDLVKAGALIAAEIDRLKRLGE